MLLGITIFVLAAILSIVCPTHGDEARLERRRTND